MLKRFTNQTNQLNKNKTRNFFVFWFTFLTMAWCTQTMAQETSTATSNEKLPVEITADTLVAKDKEGISVYQGNVVLIQGTTTIKGDKVTILHPKRKISTAVVLGKPATFKRYQAEEQSWVTGHADKITYSAADKTVLLEGNAKIVQKGENSITGPRILYDLSHKTISAKGKGQERIKMIFTPEEEKK